jgi:hypothetical protein
MPALFTQNKQSALHFHQPEHLVLHFDIGASRKCREHRGKIGKENTTSHYLKTT